MRAAPLKAIQTHISEYEEQAPRPSFVGRFVDPGVTRVMHRGSPETLRAEVMPAAPELLAGDLKLNSKTPAPLGGRVLPSGQRRGRIRCWRA